MQYFDRNEKYAISITYPIFLVLICFVECQRRQSTVHNKQSSIIVFFMNLHNSFLFFILKLYALTILVYILVYSSTIISDDTTYFKHLSELDYTKDMRLSSQILLDFFQSNRYR
jgi:hypothetical protein